MILKPYTYGSDYETIKHWCDDERTHAMWCAGRFPYPLERESFETALRGYSDRYGDLPFIAEENGKAIGFFCWSPDTDEKSGKLKFVIVDPLLRGRGYGKALVRLALDYAFDTAVADSVRLSVFEENIGAARCYGSAGFTVTGTDPGAFAFKDESWSRRNMAIDKTNYRRLQAV